MKLSTLLQKKRLTLLGLNAGTSADGLDLAVVRVDRSKDGYRVRPLTGATRKYPAALRRELIALADSPVAGLEQAIRIDQALGKFFGKTALSCMRRWAEDGIRIDAIASHGQTVRHLPEPVRLAGFSVRGSLQLGNPEQIAAITERTVIADFRQADIAVGHEGAPITTPAMIRMMSDPGESRLVVNIGGMANFFYLPAARLKRPYLAADCGPGNSLSDLTCRKFFGEPFDRNGRRALAGTVSRRLLALLEAEPFFRDRQISTGRESFGPALLERVIRQGRRLKLSSADIHATVAEITPLAIARRLGWLIRRDRTLNKLYLTGGGSRNRFFVRRLDAMLDGITVGTVAELGFDPDLVEAIAYAVLGEATLRSEGLATIGGDRRAVKPVLGRIIQPPE